MNACTNALNSIPSSHNLSARYFSAQRPVSGKRRAAQAFRFQARLVMTMYAQLLSRLSTGAVQSVHAVLELLQQVFLMATIVGREDDFMSGRCSNRW